jgi:hypothetical protein
MLFMLGQVDDGHAAFADLPDDNVITNMFIRFHERVPPSRSVCREAFGRRRFDRTYEDARTLSGCSSLQPGRIGIRSPEAIALPSSIQIP